MRFLIMFRPDRREDVPLDLEHLAKMGQHCQDAAKAGVLLMSEGLQPSSKGAKIRLSQGKISVTDGPFAEAKEVIGGISLIQAKSKEEALELAKEFIQCAGDGEIELRQVYEMSDVFPGAPNDCSRGGS